MPRQSPFRTRRAWLTILGLLAAFAALAVFFARPLKAAFTPQAERLLAEGREFAANGRLPEALLSYRQAVESDPTHAEALLALADAYQSQGRTRMAARYRARWAALTTAAEPGDANLPAQALALAWSLPVSEATPTGAFATADGILVAFESGDVVEISPDGALRWRVQLPAQATSAPFAEAGIVWVGGQDGALYALSRADGGLLWRFQTSAPVYAQPLAGGERIYCPSSDGTLYALDPASGREIWRFQTGGALLASAALDGETLFIGSADGKVYALERSTGAPVWQDGILTSGAVESQPLALDGRVLVGSGDGRIYALAQESGGQYWRAPTGDAIYAAPLAVDGVVYVASSGHALHAFDWLSGARLWKADFDSALRAAPLKIGDILYVTTEADAFVHLLDAASGAERARINTGDWITGGVLRSGDFLIITGKDGTLLAYRLPASP